MGACRAENCLYGQLPGRSTYDVDSFVIMGCQHTYQCVHCVNCFECSYCDHTNNSKFSYFLSFCNNCENCIGCVNFQTARYCILNKQYTKEEYEKLAEDILKDRTSIAAFKVQFDALVASSEKLALNNVGAEDCQSNYVQNGRHNTLCFFILEAEDNKYSSFTGLSKSGPVYDAYASTETSYSLEVSGFTGSKS
jgi:hypothetical protein